MTRPRCSVFIAASLDGFIARRDGSLDWLRAVEAAGEGYGFKVVSRRGRRGTPRPGHHEFVR